MSAIAGIPRLWRAISVPGVTGFGHATYTPVSLDAMPPLGRVLDGSLAWLLETPSHERSLQRGPDDPTERDADASGLQEIAPGLPLSNAFRTFIEDPEPRRHIRSATACYLDLAQFAVALVNGGILVHFLSDQQWVLHWLLLVGSDGSECVIVTEDPLGFDDGENEPRRSVDINGATHGLSICSETFEEFLYRFWIENELFFRLAEDKTSMESLPAELRAYALAYRSSTG